MYMEVSSHVDWWVYATCTTENCNWTSETFNIDEKDNIITSRHAHSTIVFNKFYFLRAECASCNIQTDYAIDEKELQEIMEYHNFHYHGITLPAPSY